MHLLIPFAWPQACRAEPAAQAAARGLELPNLQALLQSLQALPARHEAAESPLLAHERVLGESLGLLAPGDSGDRLAWAAWHAQRAGWGAQGGWASIWPCHWQVAQSQISLTPLPLLDLQADESDALLAAMQPYFKEDGIELLAYTPEQWLARSEQFQGWASASPQRLAGQDVAAWLPDAPALRRLQNEMQMLLYTHPVNDARSARGALPVNSFWISGCGSLPADWQPAAQAPDVVTSLTDPALRGDWAAWAHAWQTLDATALAALRQSLAQPQAELLLTLCSERSYLRLQGRRRRSWLTRSGLFGPYPLSRLWSQL